MNRLILFAKYPEAGRVKTRLARNLGANRAAQIYQTMLQKVIMQTQSLDENYQTVVFVDPPEKTGFFRKQFAEDLPVSPQYGRDLGERMANAFRVTLGNGIQKMVLIGSDCLGVTEKLLKQAFASLDDHDLVLGPATDGGYYLIGLKRLYEGLFQDITWSSPLVFQETEKKAKSLSLKTCILTQLSDIDTAEDLQAWGPL